MFGITVLLAGRVKFLGNVNRKPLFHYARLLIKELDEHEFLLGAIDLVMSQTVWLELYFGQALDRW